MVDFWNDIWLYRVENKVKKKKYSYLGMNWISVVWGCFKVSLVWHVNLIKIAMELE